MPHDFYKILEVDPQASWEVIHAAWIALSRLYEKDDVRRKKINEAWETLRENDKREEYDKIRKGGVKKGKVVGNYRILEKIASGGFGTTYKGEHISTGCCVCIKHASNISALDEQILLDEARACWDLRHWGIPCMRDIINMPDGSFALVMSYIPGRTIAQIVQEEYPNGLDAEHVGWITDRAINTLKYLHYHGVIHGDFKPGNVMIQNDTHGLTLVDYGLSAIKPTSKDQAKGFTPYFAAPEQISGGSLLPETDFYGLGMTMIYALGGDVEHIKVPGNTPPAMCALIKHLIRRDVLSRPNWKDEDLCETIEKVRISDFGRSASGMKPLKLKGDKT